MQNSKINLSSRIHLAAAGTAIVLLAASLPAHAQSAASPIPREQLQQYVTQLQANPSDDALRTKIIQLAQTLDQPPAFPPEADELAGRAQYIFEHANSPDELLKAAVAFEKVALVVPWLPDYYYDSAVAYEKANHPADALKNYRLSLLAYHPDSQDAKKVREKIGALSYVLEQQQEQARQADAEREAQENARREQQERDATAQREWSGVWRVTGGTAKDPRYRGSKIRWDSYHESHLVFKVHGDQIIKMGCFDRADAYQHSPGDTWTETGQLSGRQANFSGPLGYWATLTINDQGEIEQRDSRYPGEIPWVYSRVNDPGAISASCPQ